MSDAQLKFYHSQWFPAAMILVVLAVVCAAGVRIARRIDDDYNNPVTLAKMRLKIEERESLYVRALDSLRAERKPR